MTDPNTIRQDQLRFADPDDGVDPTTYPTGATTIEDEFNAVVTQIKNILGSADWRNAPTSDIIAIAAHLADMNNPHSTTFSNLVAGTLAQLNAIITDATLDDASDPRDPNAHAVSHIRGASDEIDGDKIDIDFNPSGYSPDTSPPQVDNVDELSAHLAGIDNVLVGGPAPGAHAVTHENGGVDEIDVGGLSGVLVDDQPAAIHALGGARHSISSLAALNALVSGATLDDSGDSRPPLSHAADHIRDGADEIDGDKLDIDWNPTNYNPITTPPEVSHLDELTAHLAGIDALFGVPPVPAAHASSHENGGGDEINVGGLSGTLADPQDPATHVSRHENGGSDEIDVGGLSGLLADSQTPLAHAASHISGGADEVDGDQLDIDWNPTNYTPATVPAEATSIDHLTAHLYGIDQELASTVTHAVTHASGAADEVDGDTIDIDWNPTNYTPATTPSQVTSIDELTAHLYGIDQVLAGPFTPATHASSHENGGGDEISVAGLSGLLADDQNPMSHASSHENGGGDEIDVGGLSGLLADPQTPATHASGHTSGGADEIDGDTLDIDWNPSNYTPTVTPPEVSSIDELTAHLAGIDGQFGVAPTPAAHATSHQNGGSDEINVAGLSGTLADQQDPANHVTRHQNGGVDELSVVGLSGLLADPQTPLGHDTTHVRGGADQIDGDILDITWNPSNYTPSTTPTEVTSVDELTAHLYGIDQVLAGPFTPASHASTHENGGADEISVAGLSGLLSDAQTPLAHAASHAGAGADPVTTLGAHTLTGDVTPSITNARDLGSSSLRFAEIWSRIVIGVSGTGGGISFGAAQGGALFGRSQAAGSQLTFGGGGFPPTALFGNAFSSNAGHSALMSHVGGGSFMAGSAYASGGSVPQTAEVLTPSSSYGSFTGGYSWTHGSAGAVGRIQNLGSGSFLWAYVNKTGGGTQLAQTGSQAQGAFCSGRLQGTGTHTLRALGAGSFVQGLLNGIGAGVIESTAAGDGGFAQGQVNPGGLIQSAAAGAFAQGFSNNAAGSIAATGQGSFAQGKSGANDIVASGAGSFAQGDATAGNITASAAGAVQLGPGTNALADSLQVGGAGLRFKGTSGPPGTPQDGDHWVTAAGLVTIRSDGGDVVLDRSPAYTPTNVVTDRSYDANATTLDEIADVLGTLIADLQATGLLT